MTFFSLLAFFDSAADGKFCDGGSGLDMYGQQYGFSYGKSNSYSYQGISLYVIRLGDLLNSPFVQLF